MSTSSQPDGEPPVLHTEDLTTSITNQLFSGSITPPFLTRTGESVHRTSPVNDVIFHGPLPFGAVAETPSYKDVPDSNAVPGVCGLRNLGNTCFMNAGLQCLMCNTKLIKHFLENLPKDIREAETLTSRFCALLEKVWCGQYSVIWPSSFKDMLATYFSQFQDYRQHDCQEFLALILDSLHEQLNECTSKRISPYSLSDQSTTDNNPQDAEAPPPNNNAILNNQMDVQGTTSDFARTQDNAEPNNLSWSKDQNLKQEVLWDLSRVSDRGRNLTPMSEESNHSTASFQSSESAMQTNTQSLQSTPSECSLNSDKLFKPIVSASATHDESMMSSDGSRATDNGPIDDCVPAVCANKDVSGSEVDGSSHMPSIEDLYMKDTKIKNVNVDVAEMEEIPTFDSEKFTKHDVNNTAAYSGFSSLNEVADFVAKPGTSKSSKSDNLFSNLPNNREKFSGECVKVKFNSMEMPHEICSINNIKRMKVDDTPKNVKQEAKKKVNVSKNITKDQVNNCDGASGYSCLASGDSAKTNTLTLNMPSKKLSVRKRTDPLTAQDVEEADKAWQQYISRNSSVIVDTFQGQFKNTVVCSECGHVSVTYEPFMYLSVPLPHAMERQISVIYISCDSQRPMRYLLTMHKQDNVQKMRKQLKCLVDDGERSDIAIAEAFKHHISRILEDHIPLRSVNDSNRTIYAFEMGPQPSVEDGCTSEDPDRPPTSQPSLDLNQSSQPNTEGCPSTFKNDSNGDGNIGTAGSESQAFMQDVFSTMGMFDSKMVNSYDSQANNSEPMSRDSPVWGDNTASDWPGAYDSQKSNEWLNPEGGWSQEAVMDQSESRVTTLEPDEDYDNFSCSQNYTSSWLAGLNKVEGSRSDGGDNHGAATATSSAAADDGKFADVWRTCAICLEEIPSSHLLTHPACGGTLCYTCYEMSLKHYGETNFSCPVCSTGVNPSECFVPVSSVPEFKPKPRILSVPVVFRQANNSLFAHPRLIYLCSATKGEVIYQEIERVLPMQGEFSVLLTDGEGLHCSRCMYTDHCSGCDVPRHGDVNLITGDHLAVKFTELPAGIPDDAEQCENHASMDKLRSNEPLSLSDCLQAFSESEILDEHNPWFCPKCSKNQCAKKTLTVWSVPDSLVIYLKRFVYHELSSTKIDSKVVFPFENFDLSDYLSGPDNIETVFDLQAAVCHFGSTTSGHYTAFCKHPLRDEWYYYNDESTNQQSPGEDTYSNAYVLFYQRQGNAPQFNLPEQPKDNEVCEAKEGAKGNDISAINPEAFTQLLQGLTYTSTGEEKKENKDNANGHSLDFYG